MVKLLLILLGLLGGVLWLLFKAVSDPELSKCFVYPSKKEVEKAAKDQLRSWLIQLPEASSDEHKGIYRRISERYIEFLSDEM